jgi:hypothetical protein
VTDEVGRAQDQSRRHRRKGAPSTETATLLAQSQAAMRAELRTLLVDLGGKLPDPGLGLGGPPELVRPPLKERIPMWDLAIKLGRELGTEVDESPPIETRNPESPTRRRRGKVDFG